LQLEADRLTCHRAGRRVLTDVSFALGPGEALAVTGRNGAGKSTLIGIVAGLIRADAGSVRATGTGERTLPESLHLVAHRDALKASLTAAENLAFAAALLGSAALAPDDALRRVGLPGAGALPVGYLSAGQRRRVALARLLVARRPLWLLDEPMTALDAAAQDLLGGIMAEHLAGGGLILAATHAPLPLDGTRELRLGAP
jgi:heme exporter protein A